MIVFWLWQNSKHPFKLYCIVFFFMIWFGFGFVAVSVCLKQLFALYFVMQFFVYSFISFESIFMIECQNFVAVYLFLFVSKVDECFWYNDSLKRKHVKNILLLKKRGKVKQKNWSFICMFLFETTLQWFVTVWWHFKV